MITHSEGGQPQPESCMIYNISIASISGLLLLGLASLCGGDTMGAAKVLGWIATVSTVAWVCAGGMELFMAYYSGTRVNGVKMGPRGFRRFVVPLAMHAVAILTCVPAIREDARWLVSACLVSLAGAIWQRNILKKLV
jgi:hypothetical protein